MSHRTDSADTDFIQLFYEATDSQNSPEIFRLWAGIGSVACAVQRRTWVHTFARLYPNMYIFLVSPPGIGKTVVTAVAGDLLTKLPGHFTASSNLSRASFVDELADARRDLIRLSEAPETFHSLSVVTDELGTLFDAYNLDFMSILTHLYDNRPFSERKRVRGTVHDLESPQVNMLVATQPAFLKALIPDIAWDQGFMSRVVMIYSAKRMKKPLFGNTGGVPMEALAKRLEPVGELYGEQTFTEEAIAFINTQYAADWPPQPKHFRLINYNERRTVHVLKLSAISAASGLSLKIELEDVQRAVGWVHQAEVAMPEVFHSMAASDDGTLTRESFDYVMTECNRTGKAVPEHNLIQFLAARTSSAKVEKLMEVLVSGKLVIPEGTQGKMAYTPGRLV